MPDLTLSVTGKKQGPTLLDVKARSFTMLVDEPENLGGEDRGPNPVEYLLASLAGCLNVVGAVVAKEMGLVYRGLTIKVEGDLNPERFMGRSMAERAGFKRIRATLEPDMQADESTREKWLETVELRCPISDNLLNPVPVSITLA